MNAKSRCARACRRVTIKINTYEILAQCKTGYQVTSAWYILMYKQAYTVYKEIFILSSSVGDCVTDKYFKCKYALWLRAAGDNGCHCGDTMYLANFNSHEVVSGFVRMSVKHTGIFFSLLNLIKTNLFHSIICYKTLAENKTSGKLWSIVYTGNNLS